MPSQQSPLCWQCQRRPAASMQIAQHPPLGCPSPLCVLSAPLCFQSAVSECCRSSESPRLFVALPQSRHNSPEDGHGIPSAVFPECSAVFPECCFQSAVSECCCSSESPICRVLQEATKPFDTSQTATQIEAMHNSHKAMMLPSLHSNGKRPLAAQEPGALGELDYEKRQRLQNAAHDQSRVRVSTCELTSSHGTVTVPVIVPPVPKFITPSPA